MKKVFILVVPTILFFLTLTIWSCESASTWKQGERLYAVHCANCHMNEGQGLAKLYPPLAKADYLALADGQLACLIRHGLKGRIEVNGVEYDMAMPGVPQLSAVEITNIINFLHHSWGNDLTTITLEDVTKQLKACKPNQE